jgi:pyruvate formate lyase activating enzyme
MNLKVVKKGFNYAQDGPGNRLVYHFQGCNMHCPWCSNPECIPPDGTMIDSALTGAKCSCAAYSADALVQEGRESRRLLFDGGGVTITGGEPTFQFAGLLELLTGLKSSSIHTAIETNGSHPKLSELFPQLDLLIIDCKHIDDQIHRRTTGRSNKAVLANIQLAFQRHPNVLVRTPLVNGFNADLKTIKEMLVFYQQFDTGKARFEFLQYHEIGKSKWQASGLAYTVQDGFVSDSQRLAFEEMYRNGGLKVVRT